MIWLHRPQTLIGKTYGEVVALAQAMGEQAPPLDGLADDRLRMSLTDSGVALVFDDGPAVRAVQLYAEGHHGFRRFVWPLPFGLSFGVGPGEAALALGAPARSGGNASHPVLGLLPRWDQFRLPDGRVHVEYTHDEAGIRLVTLTGREGWA